MSSTVNSYVFYGMKLKNTEVLEKKFDLFGYSKEELLGILLEELELDSILEVITSLAAETRDDDFSYFLARKDTLTSLNITISDKSFNILDVDKIQLMLNKEKNQILLELRSKFADAFDEPNIIHASYHSF